MQERREEAREDARTNINPSPASVSSKSSAVGPVGAGGVALMRAGAARRAKVAVAGAARRVVAAEGRERARGEHAGAAKAGDGIADAGLEDARRRRGRWRGLKVAGFVFVLGAQQRSAKKTVQR